MAGGQFAVAGEGRSYEGKLTTSVIITCVVAASGGLIFGYDIGISGGVSTMQSFLSKFFPSVLHKMQDSTRNVYCTYNSQVLTSFTSSLYIAGLVASIMASYLTKSFGRRAMMLVGGITFLMGSSINAIADNVAMLILGRILLGLGVGFTNQATPIYISEMAPHKWRGAFNTGFQFCIGLGVVVANLINYFAARADSWGWRLSLGLAGAPAMVIIIGIIIIHDTPSSLIQRGKIKTARQALQRARGHNIDIDIELEDIIKQNEISSSMKGHYQNIFHPHYRPYIVMAIAIPMFQQLTGINIIAFYAPILFQTVGFGNDSALMAAIILGVVNLFSILVSTYVVDRYGRRALFLQGGVQMFISQVIVACILATKVGVSGELSKDYSIFILVMICIYAAGFGWSWGPLSWLVPSEIFPMEVRSIGQSIVVAINFAVTFALAQSFLTTLCHFKYGVFLFYAGWILLMTTFIALLLPETKGISLDSMHKVWEQHWFWKKFVSNNKPR